MSETQAGGLLVIVGILAITLAASIWVLRRQDKRRQAERLRFREPAPGSFAAAVLAAEGASNEYRTAILTGDAAAISKALGRVRSTAAILIVAVVKRQVEARAREQKTVADKVRDGEMTANQARAISGFSGLYASGPRSVSVSESDRLAGEPTKQTGRRRAHDTKHRR